MGLGLDSVVRRGLADARAAGKDHLTPTETACEALSAVDLVRRS